MKNIFLNKLNLQFATVTDNLNHRVGNYDLKNKFTHFFSEWLSNPSSVPQVSGSRLERIKGKNVFDKKKLVSVITAVVGLLILVLIGRALLSGGSSDEKVEIKEAKAETEINREFSFPLKDSKGEEVSTFKYTVEKAEIRDEIVVKGQRASAIKGREFLIINLKLSNDYDKPIQINTRDYVRLAVNGNESEWLAPEIHNDPAEVQAISTKNTRVGFPINESDEKLVIQVGEINGNKEKIELSLN
jgi:hypothetical protein